MCKVRRLGRYCCEINVPIIVNECFIFPFITKLNISDSAGPIRWYDSSPPGACPQVFGVQKVLRKKRQKRQSEREVGRSRQKARRREGNRKTGRHTGRREF